jgi:protein-tyrosine phosphatase
MVCLGNICRSPIAEIIFRQKVKKAGLPWVVESAGTNRYHKGGPADERAVQVCKQKGLDLSGHIARRLTPADFERYDILFSMAADVTEEMLEIAGSESKMGRVRGFLDVLFPGEARSVPDPWYGGPRDFEKCWALIERAIAEWLEKGVDEPPSTS